MYFGTCTQRNKCTSKGKKRNCRFSFDWNFNAQADLTVWLFSSTICCTVCCMYQLLPLVFDWFFVLRLFAHSFYFLLRSFSSFSFYLSIYPSISFFLSPSNSLILIDLTSNIELRLIVGTRTSASQNKSESNWRANAFMWTTLYYILQRACNAMWWDENK